MAVLLFLSYFKTLSIGLAPGIKTMTSHSADKRFTNWANPDVVEDMQSKSTSGYKNLPLQPSKLKFLLGRHLATNSFGLGKLFYKSSHQLQNVRHYGDQNSHNLEGCT